ncbi:MAG: hypothetical protein ABIF45_17975 [Pseudomonadota bacterium]
MVFGDDVAIEVVDAVDHAGARLDVARDPVDMLEVIRRVSASGGALELLDEPFIDSMSEMADLILFIVG